jgi:hypothetical protein
MKEGAQVNFQAQRGKTQAGNAGVFQAHVGFIDCIGMAGNCMAQFVKLIAGVNSIVGRGSECRRRFEFRN